MLINISADKQKELSRLTVTYFLVAVSMLAMLAQLTLVLFLGAVVTQTLGRNRTDTTQGFIFSPRRGLQDTISMVVLYSTALRIRGYLTQFS